MIGRFSLAFRLEFLHVIGFKLRPPPVKPFIYTTEMGRDGLLSARCILYGTMAVETPLAFFSYARDDSRFALQLAKDLKLSGIPVWLDQLDIPPGQRWDKAVEGALANCPRMLVILSPAAVDSTNVMDEVSFALEERKVVIPVLYRECKVPFRLRRVQYVDFRGEYGRGLSDLLKVMGVETAKSARDSPDRAPFQGPHVLVKPRLPIWQLCRSMVRKMAATNVRAGPMYLTVLVWLARMMSLAEALWICFMSFQSSSVRELLLFLVPISLAQVAAWKWEWQGSATALVLNLALATFGPVDSAAEHLFLLVFSAPATLFLIHWGLTRKLSLKA